MPEATSNTVNTGTITMGSTSTTTGTLTAVPSAQIAQTAPATPPAQAPSADAEHWRSEARKWEERAKANKDAAGKLDGEAKRADEAEAALAKAGAELAAANRELAVIKAAAEAGVSADVLGRMKGETAEEIAENARILAESMPARPADPYPDIPDGGRRAAVPKVTADQIREIRDPRERIRARAEHPELFAR